MRTEILNSLFESMIIDKNIFFLTADMGIGIIERFKEKFPNRFLNVGIAEQNLIGIAAGLANLGYKPFVYTISNFAIHRCFEQIRNEIGLHKYKITILGTSCGYDNAPLGPTHHVVDDWSALSNIPNIDIFCPSSTAYAKVVLKKAIDNKNPSYIRIPKGAPEEPISCEDYVFIKGITNDFLYISYGLPVQECLKVIRKNKKASLIVLNKIHPLPSSLLNHIISFQKVFVVEDQFPENGLYSKVCKLLINQIERPIVKSIAPQEFDFSVGINKEYFFEKHLLSSDKLEEVLI